MTSRDRILQRLRAAQVPFADRAPIAHRRNVTLVENQDVVKLFIAAAEALSTRVSLPVSEADAIHGILDVIGRDQTILAWDFDQIPLAGLRDALAAAGVQVADAHDGAVRVGITGVDAALAATGSIVVSAQPGRPRTVSLLPYVHVAVVRREQIFAHLEAWTQHQQAQPDAFRASGNHVIITGASRTADIAMELVLGAHGPAQLHLVIV